MICPKCSSKISDGEAFCPVCGLNLSNEAAVETLSATKKKSFISGGISSVLGLIALVLSGLPVVLDLCVNGFRMIVNVFLGQYMNETLATILQVISFFYSVGYYGIFAIAVVFSIVALIVCIILKKRGGTKLGVVLSAIALSVCAVLGIVNSIGFIVGFITGFVQSLMMYL